MSELVTLLTVDVTGFYLRQEYSVFAVDMECNGASG